MCNYDLKAAKWIVYFEMFNVEMEELFMVNGSQEH